MDATLVDIDIDGTIEFVKQLSDDPITKFGIPYENGLDELCEQKIC